MANAKSGEFWLQNPQRSMANNSAVYTEKPEVDIFMEEWLTLMKSGTGERGIVNRQAIQNKMKQVGRKVTGNEALNPCGEVTLHPKQFCNLTEVILRPTDSLSRILNKIKSAVTLGMYQSTLTKFPFLDKKWKENAENDRILGVSLTGLKDHFVLQNNTPDAEKWLHIMKEYAHKIAKKKANDLSISTPLAITTTKPSGTVSQLVGCSSGLHASYSRYYIRRIRIATTDPMATLLMRENVPHNPEVGQSEYNATTLVFEFPIQAPLTAILARNETAIEQLEYWKMITSQWTDHNASCTIYVREHEWIEVGAWVYKHFDSIIGLSFLPLDTHVYQLAPYEEITEEKYNMLKASMSPIDFNKLAEIEKEDYTTGAKEYACTGGSCEI